MTGATAGAPRANGAAGAAVHDAVSRALAEDVGPLGDLSAALLPPGIQARGAIVPRAGGVLAGRAPADLAFALVDPSIRVSWEAGDGQRITAGKPVAYVSGPLAGILTAERTALNFLSHLSGIATLTRRFLDAAEAAAAAIGGRPVSIRDTRKTTPGLRALEKAAVRAGGGLSHRESLSESVLLKDNHLSRMSITEAVGRARRQWPGRTVQVECDTPAHLAEAVAAGADLVLLDNMSPEEVRECVEAVGDRCEVEVSGGVTLENVHRYVAAGARLLAVGALTHSAPALDIGLDVGLDMGLDVEGRFEAG